MALLAAETLTLHDRLLVWLGARCVNETGLRLSLTDSSSRAARALTLLSPHSARERDDDATSNSHLRHGQPCCE